jgi:hypothetical protein
MAQYVIYTDGVDTCRDGIRDGDYVVDIELTDLGFDGVEDTDWENLETLTPSS